MNHDMHVAMGIGIDQGIDMNAGISGVKGMPGSELGDRPQYAYQ